MTKSENSSNISNEQLVQLPLKGFHVEVKSPKDGWRKLIEGMGEGRVRYHMVKIKK